jgi:guanine deaminase
MLRRGCTACYDLVYEFPQPTRAGLDAVCRAYSDAGMRAVVAPMIADRSVYQAMPGLYDALSDSQKAAIGSFSLPDPAVILATVRDLVGNWSWDTDLIKPAVAPTIPMHCSEPLLTGCRDLAAEFGIGIHMHIAESRVQVVAARELYNTGMLAYLERIGLLGEHFTAAHGVWLDEEDYARLAGAGAGVVHMPLSNLRLGVGLARITLARAAKLNIGLATDGANSADELNLFEVIKLATLVSRTFGDAPDQWITAADAIGFATQGSARCLGWGDRLGSLAVGKRADITFLDATHTAFSPFNSAPVQIANCDAAGAVSDVMVDGKFVVRDGELTRVDAKAARANLDRIAQAHFAQTGPLREKSDAVSPSVVRYAQQYGARIGDTRRYAGKADT